MLLPFCAYSIGIEIGRFCRSEIIFFFKYQIGHRTFANSIYSLRKNGAFT